MFNIVFWPSYFASNIYVVDFKCNLYLKNIAIAIEKNTEQN